MVSKSIPESTRQALCPRVGCLHLEGTPFSNAACGLAGPRCGGKGWAPLSPSSPSTQVLRMQCLPFAPVLREGWAALLQEGLLGPLWRVLPRMLRAHHQGAGHGKCPPASPGGCVCVHRLLPAPDLSPIISLVLLFTGFLIPQCLLGLFVRLYPSAPICGASSAPTLGWVCTSERRQRGEATGAEGAAELGSGPTNTHTLTQTHTLPSRWPGS